MSIPEEASVYRVTKITADNIEVHLEKIRLIIRRLRSTPADNLIDDAQKWSRYYMYAVTILLEIYQ